MEYSSKTIGNILAEKFNLPENTVSFSLKVSPGEAIVTIDMLASIEAAEFITQRFRLVQIDDDESTDSLSHPQTVIVA